MEERSAREASYPRKESRTFHEEALDVGAVDLVHAKVERSSLHVACGLRGSLRIGVAVDDSVAKPGTVSG
jgi:hypothetical protein